jgi:hypothetical protein
MIGSSAQQVVGHDDLTALLLQRDRIVWLINRCTVATLVTSLADTDAAVKRIADATGELEKLKSTSDDITKAVDVAKTIVTVAAGVVAAVL